MRDIEICRSGVSGGGCARNLGGGNCLPAPRLTRLYLLILRATTYGEVPEWFKGTVLKTVVSAMVPRVRISPSPPNKIQSFGTVFYLRGWGDSNSPRSKISLLSLPASENRRHRDRLLYETTKKRVACGALETVFYLDPILLALYSDSYEQPSVGFLSSA